MHVNRILPWVELNQIFLQLTNASNCALQSPLDEDTLLRVHHLIVTLL